MYEVRIQIPETTAYIQVLEFDDEGRPKEVYSRSVPFWELYNLEGDHYGSKHEYVNFLYDTGFEYHNGFYIKRSSK